MSIKCSLAILSRIRGVYQKKPLFNSHSFQYVIRYVGATVDITRRLRQHNGELRGGAKRTSSGRPWKVVALVEVGEKIPALKLEWKLKRARGKTKRLALFTKLCTDNNLTVNIFSSAATTTATKCDTHARAQAFPAARGDCT